MVSYVLVGLGAVLLTFGVIGLRSPEDIVRTQHREGMTAFEGAHIDDATRTRVTRYVAAGCVGVGVALVAVGLGIVSVI